jgi:antitoxin component YwqK of YwqJK toxin-antitoxin module
MKNLYFTIIIVFMFVILCINGITSEGVTVKFRILSDPGSESPKYELVFYQNGKEIAKRIFQAGKTILSEGEIPDGVVVECYDDGRIKNIFNYKDGKRNGKAFGFYKSGKLKAIGTYQDDNPIGSGKMYYENGIIMAEWEIVDGKEKFHKEYYENGQLKEEIYYKGDKIIKNVYDVHGNIIRTQR